MYTLYLITSALAPDDGDKKCARNFGFVFLNWDAYSPEKWRKKFNVYMSCICMPVPKYDVLSSGRLYHETVRFHVSIKVLRTQRIEEAGDRLLIGLTFSCYWRRPRRHSSVFVCSPASIQSILDKHRLALTWRGIGPSQGLPPHRTTQTQIKPQKYVSFPRVFRVHVCTVREFQHYRLLLRMA